nr:hypothetical protein [Armatimonadota bacterium]
IEFLVIALGLGFGFGATAWLTAKFDLRRPNFRNVRIPAVAGLAFVLAAEWVYAYEWLAERLRLVPLDVTTPAAFFLVTLGFGTLGLLDDLKGDRSIGGFRGHFAALRQGRLTTGALKALGGGLFSLIAGYLICAPNMWLTLLAGALIALSANALNLLDLRPGRCLFGFFLGAAVIIATLLSHHIGGYGFYLYVAVGIALILYPLDASGRVMLGDTGSNAFGAVLGLSAALYFSPLWQVVTVVVLLLFQWWCERRSLSKTIDSNPILRSLDRKIGVR